MQKTQQALQTAIFLKIMELNLQQARSGKNMKVSNFDIKFSISLAK